MSLGRSPVNVSEDIGNVTVCVSLSAAENTERSISVNITTKAHTAHG